MGRQELVPIIEPLARRAEYSGDALLYQTGRLLHTGAARSFLIKYGRPLVNLVKFDNF